MPFTKPNNIPLYVHKKSNHPPQIIENIPLSINKRLSEISYDQNSFDKAAPLYQKALSDSGYKHRLVFSPPDASQPQNSTRNNRHRDILWYNPHSAKMLPLTSDGLSLRSSTKSSQRTTCCTTSLTATQ